ncbi:MAG: Xaa-Pro aminopeptidase [Gammaproteobacteria bacterium]|nr:Xaa-Pro aminopeptidase [Gammaproteobacteria bacterium]NIR81909.1 Xaa-Pro aminopeptidase [Gammaproteobacteria bacterium]NIR88741.1 Xaa-Pro aminopeptidase [Gammaproteobacteria bacterium]NIU03017.1 Xaa-Pro aminopeptidase [Gammaproteobacteria bacterium]NIV50538.1 Xaa-Pro aminopeptidase [Gammaproteobacteria bacterium]
MTKREFARRRKRVMEMMDERSIALLPAAPMRARNRDVEYPYRPDSDFYYLTGFPEPEAVAVLVPGRPQGEYLLFCRERAPDAEVWTGVRIGLEGACELYGADDAFPIGDVDDILPGIMENRQRVLYAMGYLPDFDQRVLAWVNRIRSRSRAGVNAPVEFAALDHVLHDMRLYKSRAELRFMRRAAEVSVRAHRRAMRACRPGLREYQIEAELVHEFMSSGARAPAYPSIVASGENACVLHYTGNDSVLKAGELLLIDAGAEYEYYASDITRTFPIGGRFSRAQRAVYELVLEAQQAAIEQVRPGNHWNDPHEAAVRALTEGLVTLGLLKGRVGTLLKKERYRRFYMHRTGHWLGMDVHDVGDYKVGGEWRVLEPGMVMTVEPGLYIGSGHKDTAKKWRGIGVRIEDDVLVTPEGHEVLSGALPKGVDEVEALVGDRQGDRAAH